MIYLKKDGAIVTTNDEDMAAMFEADGYTRIRGWRYLAMVIGKTVKKTVLELAFPMLAGLVLFHLCDGRDPGAFVLGAYMLYIVHVLLSG